jgi:3-oxoacyl-[acyl-carrier-protein] synthase III
MREDKTHKNTDKEIWRKVNDDYYSPSIHVTEQDGIGINISGMVIVKPVEEWYRLAIECDKYNEKDKKIAELERQRDAAVVQADTFKKAWEELKQKQEVSIEEIDTIVWYNHGCSNWTIAEAIHERIYGKGEKCS